MPRFSDKVVVVTGTGSGIGRAVAERFSAEGANVVVAGHTPAKPGAVAAGLDAGRTLVHVCDVSKYTEVETLVAVTIVRFGRLDVMVNNAGIAPSGRAAGARLRRQRRAR